MSRGLLVLFLLASASSMHGATAGQPKHPRAHAKHTKKHSAGKPAAEKLDAATVNDAALTTPVAPGSNGAAVLRAQILLDRAHFSCGEIDAHYGHDLGNAINAYERSHDLPVNGTVGPEVWKLLNSDTAPALLEYTIAPEDVKGPFEKIPEDMLEKAKLPAMNYESALEELGEKFHVSPHLLATLNPDKALDQPGTTILVPNVITPVPPQAAQVVVNGTDRSVEALDASGKILAFYPATVGSEHDPLPVGEWKVTHVQKNPWFFYNSDLFWDANEAHAKAKIHPGPNNPVGVVWIGLTKEHYGIHGTPEPSTIGHTQSHGCIRLTNWDATELAQMVAKGTPVILKD
jgi:lipoprotein-anchoring transpeptidase ErfK/SrfK